MNDIVAFYYNPMSRGRLVHWALEEVGAKYEIKFLDWKTNQQKSPEYLELNPMGKVPAIVHRSTVVTETTAICMYLADAFPENNLAPKVTDPERGSYYRWILFMANCLEPAVADKNSPRVKEMPAGQLGYGTYADMVRVLEGAVKDGFLVGGKFSMADLCLSSVLGWYFFQKLMEPSPTLLKYVERCHDRPACKKFNEDVQKMMAH
jgi:glutathione S-transferase